MLDRTLKVTIGGKEYEIEYPRVANLIDIDLVKIKLTDSHYEAYRKNFPKRADQIDAISTVSVIMPRLLKDIGVSILQLDAVKMDEITDVYLKEIKPWMDSKEDTMHDIAVG